MIKCAKCGNVATVCHVSARWVYCIPCLEDYLKFRAERAMKVLRAIDNLLEADLAYQNKRLEDDQK